MPSRSHETMKLIVLMSTFSIYFSTAHSHFTCKDANGIERKETEEWTEWYYVKKCNAGHYIPHIKIIACLTKLGQRIEIGKAIQEGTTTYTCAKTNGGAQIYQMVSACRDACGKIRQPNEEWQEHRFLKKCVIKNLSISEMVITACIAETGHRIEIGASLKIGNQMYNCYLQNGTPKFWKQ